MHILYCHSVIFVIDTMKEFCEWADLWSGFDGWECKHYRHCSYFCSDLNKYCWITPASSLHTGLYWLMMSEQLQPIRAHKPTQSWIHREGQKVRVWSENSAARNVDHHPRHTHRVQRAEYITETLQPYLHKTISFLNNGLKLYLIT